MSAETTPAAWSQPLPEWLSLQEASALYGVSVDTLRRRIAAGKLRASRFGVRLIRVRAEDLDQQFRPIPTGDDSSHRRRVSARRRPW